MPRMRVIKPDFFKNEDLAEIPLSGRLLFAGLWCWADREGRLEDRPKRIKVEVFPYDDIAVEELLADLDARGFIIRYEVAGVPYIQIPNFAKHQHPYHREQPSTIPAVPEDHPDGPTPNGQVRDIPQVMPEHNPVQSRPSTGHSPAIARPRHEQGAAIAGPSRVGSGVMGSGKWGNGNRNPESGEMGTRIHETEDVVDPETTARTHARERNDDDRFAHPVWGNPPEDEPDHLLHDLTEIIGVRGNAEAERVVWMTLARCPTVRADAEFHAERWKSKCGKRPVHARAVSFSEWLINEERTALRQQENGEPDVGEVIEIPPSGVEAWDEIRRSALKTYGAKRYREEFGLIHLVSFDGETLSLDGPLEPQEAEHYLLPVVRNDLIVMGLGDVTVQFTEAAS